MSLENFTSYTETDPNTKITKTASRVTWALLARNEDAYVYADKGANYFAGQFKINLTVSMTASVGASLTNGVWSLTNLVDDLKGIDVASGDYLTLYQSDTLTSAKCCLVLEECDGGTLHSDTSINLNDGTIYYVSIVRDETVGTYGTLYCYIYSDVTRETLVDTLTVTLNTSKKDFRYLYACHSYNSAEATLTGSGYTEAMEIVYNYSTPTVTIQPLTDISGTTATGHGTITKLGSSAVTQHGHCWVADDYATPPTLPTTSDSKTSNGAGALGAFTSAITGLTAGIDYIFRAYATNAGGTGYSAYISIRAGVPGTQLEPLQIAMGNTTFLYSGRDGNRYYVQGVMY